MIPRLSLVVARARNGVIGRDGGLPWRLRSDLQRFKALTMGKPCLMGRATWESLPLKPLPGRLNIVLTRDEGWGEQGEAKTSLGQALICTSLDEALEIAREQAVEDGVDEICVIGGAALYAATLPRANRLHLTEVEAAPEGDTLFPAFDEAQWIEVSCERQEPGEKDDHAFVFRTLERR
ncbi:dihydrofolate reductase [Brevundimonas sp.]|uniref:dihydrofolate reductase n=1 Tax=Brevundimonas sp. TaxID=1871086 RepID=UPI00261EDC6A|nr:dihydrofolate reductase [Brevundimonas sp.]